MITRRFLLLALLFGVTIYALLTWNPGGSVVYVTVEPSGTARIDGTKIDATALASRLRKSVEENPGVTILIQVRETTPAGHVLAIVDVAKEAGAVNIDIETAP
jgi:biopolymer transport protein ExbD